MDIEWYRDLAITIWAFTATVLVIVIGTMFILVLMKLFKLLDRLSKAASDISAITSVISEVVGSPLARIACFVSNIQKGISSITRHFKGSSE